ncbi:helix-turn-helix domain-containing protein [Streptomyces sp. NPDC018610]|uniref:helix-turn-helix domain-containing protein n=1 Tax=Streptomyces sp. NPDC018610 TaxID=3365049 RepID=UPI0037A9ED65
MGAWQALPDDLPPEVRHFTEQLRLLKDGTGLSLVALGARTAYSKSSWQRYLNATQPPPAQAVAALCRVAGLSGADAERHAVRWEMAVKAWPRGGQTDREGGTDAVHEEGAVHEEEAVREEEAGRAEGARCEEGAGRAEGREQGERGESDGDAERDARPGPERRGERGEEHEPYEEVPTVPWWDRPPEPPRAAPGGRLLLYAVALLAVVLLTAVVSAVLLG